MMGYTRWAVLNEEEQDGEKGAVDNENNIEKERE